jgi:hypothetical protein
MRAAMKQRAMRKAAACPGIRCEVRAILPTFIDKP